MKKHFVNNAQLRQAIHDSKKTFGEYLSPEYMDYDAIVQDLSEVNEDLIATIITKRSRDLKSHVKKHGTERSISQDIVIRVMTYDDVPDVDPSTRKSRRSRPDKVVLPFPPFRHYARINNELVLVGKSHWQGDLETGRFVANKGKVTDELARLMLLMVEKYAGNFNWRGYSYNEEMQGHALIQLLQGGLKFDESKSDNPFAYYTQTMKNAFTRIWQLEKNQQLIRDELLVMSGSRASYTYENDHEHERALKRHENNQSGVDDF